VGTDEFGKQIKPKAFAVRVDQSQSNFPEGRQKEEKK
jgi:hypothetical protein